MLQRDYFKFEVTSELRFTAQDTALLMKCSARHYDLTCRKAGLLGGFVYGMHMGATELAEENGTGTYPLTLMQLDLLAKIMESGGTGEEVDLYLNVKRLLREAIDASTQANRHLIDRTPCP